MSILTVTIPVPAVGDGPIVDVSSIVGPKTVQLSGDFIGQYDLQASQDDTTFVSVLAFRGGGDIEQTISGSFKSFRVRSKANSLGSITCEVSGVDGVSQNFFAVLAQLGSGFAGSTLSIDTWSLFPPTGVEEDVCFLCRGSFQGPLIVQGSTDGTSWNAIGAFSTGNSPTSDPPVALEFDPMSTVDKTRYLRIVVPMVTTGPVTVTLGGRIPATGGSAIDPVARAMAANAQITALGASSSAANAQATANAAIPLVQKGAANGVATLDPAGKVTASQLPSLNYIPTSEKGAANGVATLDAVGKVTASQLPSLAYIPTAEKGAANGVATLDAGSLIPAIQIPTLPYLPTSARGAVNGVASLDAGGLVPSAQIPALAYIPTSARGAANGVASLDAGGLVPSAQIPALAYIPTSARGAANGVASLDAGGLVPVAQLPTTLAVYAHSTDVNVAGPYVVLATDYVLLVRRTASAAISINLPSIAATGDGRLIVSIDSGYNCATFNITLVRDGSDKINNVSGNYIQNSTGSAIWLKANATTSNWEII